MGFDGKADHPGIDAANAAYAARGRSRAQIMGVFDLQRMQQGVVQLDSG